MLNYDLIYKVGFNQNYETWLSLGFVSLILTEFTANTTSLSVAGSIWWTLTTQAPQPPSLHIVFVPNKCVYSRIYLERDVPTGTFSETIKKIILTLHFDYYTEYVESPENVI